MFASVLIGFIAGMIVAMVIVVMSGNPRADQLEAELAYRISEREELEFDVADLKLRNDELQSRLSQSLDQLMQWEDWGRQMPGDRSLSMARYAVSVGTTA